MEKKRVIIKIGSSSLQHKETGKIDFYKMERLVQQRIGRCISQFRRDCGWQDIYGNGETPRDDCPKAGMRRCRAGKAYDDVPKDVCGIPSDGRAGFNDEKYNGGSCRA